MPSEKITRGFGILEKFLSILRMKRAHKFIKKNEKNGAILDIGCGSYPLFLLNSNFKIKYGIDQEIKNIELKNQNLILINHNILSDSKLPFQRNFFDVITMLAFIEHLEYNQILRIIKECYNLLKKDGFLIITTPAKWSDLLLRLMAKIHLVSPQEIKEHKNAFTLEELKEILFNAKFEKKKIRIGFFEFYFNIWVCAVK